ncbi:hypothetical protein K1X84_04495 [bacterium]|nr:hypothetical protein [bacterium]
MDIESKEKSITMAREIEEAMETLDIALVDGAEDREIIEAKNVVAGVLRSYKIFMESFSGAEKDEAHKLFAKKIDAMAHKAKQLK